ncbi:MAG: DUF805 domain-containing protein [Candidatus Latescibacterota bacterium]|jgi:uncharacterized membrane protein YhaH (DUF805 family)
MKELFTMQGRFNRQRYVTTSLVISLIMFALAFAIGFAMGMAGIDPGIATGVSYLISIAGIIVWSFLVVKRLHDLGKPGWHYWLMYIPLYNIYLGLVLLFTKGVTGPNQYGEDPCKA